jgi:hypothetical protein
MVKGRGREFIMGSHGKKKGSISTHPSATFPFVLGLSKRKNWGREGYA